MIRHTIKASTLNRSDMAHAVLRRFKQRWYANDDCPDDAAVFLRHESGRLHCEAKVNFSPALAHILEKLRAEAMRATHE